ncbi:MAG: terminase, partial [Candidatus Solibacter usitatus]|nr:terminase [Candidatus Solibacter usitatus]
MRLLDVLDPVTFARQALGFQPDPIQSAVLLSTSKRCILNCTRQWGKSTIAAIIALHRALFIQDSLILCLSPSERQSAELIRKIQAFVIHLNLRPKSD